MTDGRSVLAFSLAGVGIGSALDRRPIACAAAVDPGRVAVADTPVLTFGQLHEQVTVTA